MKARGGAALAVLASLVAGLVGGLDTAPPAAAVLRPCSSGLVALTFDDGPSTTVTGRLLDVLTERDVPATFFVVGERVAAAKHLTQSAYRRGFVIANHTYRHEALTTLSNDGIRSTLHRTATLLRSIGVRPSPLMRPPYGLTDGRVAKVVEDMGLTSVLWDVDSRNWEPATPSGLAARVLSSLQPGGRNVVLLHDGVARSTTTLAAVPQIVAGARERGYCFAELGPTGVPVPPVPEARVSDARVREVGPRHASALRFLVRLDRPTSVPVSVRVRTVSGTARPYADFEPLKERLVIPSGSSTGIVDVRVPGDRVDESRERLQLVLDEPTRLIVRDRRATGTIVDDDPLPRVRMTGGQVAEPLDGSALTSVLVTLDRSSSRRVVLVVGTSAASADEGDYVPWQGRVVLEPGVLRARVPLEVLADSLEEPAEAFVVAVVTAVNARAPTTGAEVTITPPPTEPLEPTVQPSAAGADGGGPGG